MEPAPPKEVRRREPRNVAALAGLGCGLASIVPWVVVLTFPLAMAFGVIGLVHSTRLPRGEGRGAALLGMGIAVVAAIFHVALAGLASLVGMLFGG